VVSAAGDETAVSVDAIVDQISERISSKITAADLAQTIETACDPCNGCGQCVEKQSDEVRRIIELGAGRISSRAAQIYQRRWQSSSTTHC